MSSLPLHRLGIACAACMVVACSTLAGPQEQAARITGPSAQCHAQIEKTLADFLAAPVTVAKDVFTGDSVLLLEKPDPRDATGRRLDGRLLGMPERFHLVTDGKRCIVQGKQASQRAVLDNCTCREQAAR